MSQLYFAYGSNLNQYDWNRWCRQNGFSEGLLRVVGSAYLPDHELRFSRYSYGRGGGALNVVPAIGKTVEGVLFDVLDGGWQALDKKEGAPHVYRRTDVPVLDGNGVLSRAFSYIVTPEHDAEFVTPAPGYAEIVAEGLQEFGLTTRYLDAAAYNIDVPFPTRAFFFYGTLMQGQRRHQSVEEAGIERLQPAACEGRLVDLGDYPGMLQSPSESSTVRGEWIEVRDFENATARFDEIEGFLGHLAPDSLYTRRLIEAKCDDGGRHLAWTYYYERDDGEPIPTGCWRTHSAT